MSKDSTSKPIVSHIKGGFGSKGTSRDMAKGPRKNMAKGEISNQVQRPPKK